MDNKTWLLIANSTKARIYAVHKARIFKDPEDVSNLELINEFEHAESRKKRLELVSDRQGFYGSGNFELETDPKVHEAEVFALEIVKYIEGCRADNKFKDLNIISPANFMGLLNKHISVTTQKLVTQSIEKDYTQQNGRSLIKSLLSHW